MKLPSVKSTMLPWQLSKEADQDAKINVLSPCGNSVNINTEISQWLFQTACKQKTKIRRTNTLKRQNDKSSIPGLGAPAALAFGEDIGHPFPGKSYVTFPDSLPELP